MKRTGVSGHWARTSLTRVAPSIGTMCRSVTMAAGGTLSMSSHLSASSALVAPWTGQPASSRARSISRTTLGSSSTTRITPAESWTGAAISRRVRSGASPSRRSRPPRNSKCSSHSTRERLPTAAGWASRSCRMPNRMGCPLGAYPYPRRDLGIERREPRTHTDAPHLEKSVVHGFEMGGSSASGSAWSSPRRSPRAS